MTFLPCADVMSLNLHLRGALDFRVLPMQVPQTSRAVRFAVLAHTPFAFRCKRYRLTVAGIALVGDLGQQANHAQQCVPSRPQPNQQANNLTTTVLHY